MELASTMKAIRYYNHGGPDVLRLEEVPVPNTGEGEVLVSVHGVGVNPGDWQIRSGFAGDRFELPYIPGWDVSGVVVSVDDNVTGFRPGDMVFGMTANSGGCAEYVAVPARHLVLMPGSIDFVEAAALPQSGFTAWHALFVQGKLEAGQTVLINGAAGGVGHLALQLARWKGANVIGTASARNEPFLRELGVDKFVDYAAALPTGITQSVDVVLDTVGGDNGDWLLDTLKPGGRLIPIAWGRYSSEKAAKASISVQEVQYPPIAAAYLEKFARLVDTGLIKVAIDSVFPLEETAKAHEKSESRRVRGKIVIRVR
ncbi:NADP-dependent oxidoreductase [Paenibacillus sp. LHD-117]|uniref:NADP-dependent oxidoreductase n=1 Tax=Paenibacillus sp. LHD-117 TaxID=3071412 RepID=UPI0027DED16E|nr:NADP-dependent oxidoreductase [Paenibacillus sp. LHD-117]MDQ6421996.1 NADP-dependent oxidoreductase [Paenibacillus sp. LHD-117]